MAEFAKGGKIRVSLFVLASGVAIAGTAVPAVASNPFPAQYAYQSCANGRWYPGFADYYECYEWNYNKYVDDVCGGNEDDCRKSSFP